MECVAKTKAGEWLERKFLDWQKQEGERKTVVEFADWIGVSRGAFNQWMNGSRVPSEESLGLIAAKLGFEIYDVVGLPRPDPRLQAIIQNWGKLTNEQQEALAAEAERSAQAADQRVPNGK